MGWNSTSLSLTYFYYHCFHKIRELPWTNTGKINFSKVSISEIFIWNYMGKWRKKRRKEKWRKEKREELRIKTKNWILKVTIIIDCKRSKKKCM